MFIPDTNLRNWLNTAKPNSVDVNGYCDTVAWNAVPPVQVSFRFDLVPNNTTVDLAGIPYLKMMRIVLQENAALDHTIIWPGYPRANNQFIVNGLDIEQIPGILPLPTALITFSCTACGITSIPAFSGTQLMLQDLDLGQIPALPSSITGLNIRNCNISEVPPLPPALDGLTLQDDSLSAIPALPAGLLNFAALNIGIPTLPALPAGLGSLTWKWNGTTSLPALPTLSSLDVSYNALTSLPALPDGLWVLRADHNPITTLAGLPDEIEYVYMDSCAIASIDHFPDSLLRADLEAGQFNVLPPIPPRTYSLNLRHCQQLECLPVLPQGMEDLLLFGSGVSCLPNITPDLVLTGGQWYLGIAPLLCNPGNSACPIVDPLVTGTVFNDANANGVQDGGEPARLFATVEAQPGNFLAGSNWDGRYVLPVDTGNFTVTGQPTLYEGTTTTPYAVSFTSIGQVDSLNDVGYEVVPGIYDLVCSMEAAPTRPGYGTTVWITVENAGTEVTDADVEMTFDSNLDYVSSSYTPSSVAGNVISWNAGALYPGYSWTAAVTFYTPPFVSIGTPLLHTGEAQLAQSDMTPPDNITVLNDTAVGSYDPNDKRVRPQTMTPADVGTGAPLTWTIRFQNTGTFSAERVLITDTLSADLRWNTMDIISASHAHSWYILKGVLHILFENINLPDSASDEPGSHGFVKFRMEPQMTLADGAQVENVANIYFDFNDPVVTNTAVFTIDQSTGPARSHGTGTLRLWPNPTSDVLVIDGLPAGTSATIEVMDITGKVIDRQRCAGPRAQIDVRDLAPSAYALRSSDGVVTATHTFIKR